MRFFSFAQTLVFCFLCISCASKKVYKLDNDSQEKLEQNFQSFLKEDFDRIDRNGNEVLDRSELSSELKASKKSLKDFSRQSGLSEKPVSRKDFESLYSAAFGKTDSLASQTCPMTIELPIVPPDVPEVLARTQRMARQEYQKSKSLKAKYKSFSDYQKFLQKKWGFPEDLYMTTMKAPPVIQKKTTLPLRLTSAVLGERLEKSYLLKPRPYALFCNYEAEGFEAVFKEDLSSSYCEMKSAYREVVQIRGPGTYGISSRCEGDLPETCQVHCLPAIK